MVGSVDERAGEPEQRPLLQDADGHPDHGTIERQADHGQQQYENGIPLADEPSTLRLVLTMGSMWVGVFLAALGMHLAPPYTNLSCKYLVESNC